MSTSARPPVLLNVHFSRFDIITPNRPTLWLSRAFGAADWLDIIARINRSTGRNDLVER